MKAKNTAVSRMLSKLFSLILKLLGHFPLDCSMLGTRLNNDEKRRIQHNQAFDFCTPAF